MITNNRVCVGEPYVYVHGPSIKPFKVHVARKTDVYTYTTFGTFRNINNKWIVDSRFYITSTVVSD
jgi:hypothetical protein